MDKEEISRVIHVPGSQDLTLVYMLTGESGSWGLRCVLQETGECAQAADVTPVRGQAVEYLRRMSEGTVTPVTFPEVLEDLLP